MLAVNLPLNCRPQLLDVSSALWSVESTAYQETAYYAAIKTFSLNKIYAWKTERRPLDLLQFLNYSHCSDLFVAVISCFTEKQPCDHTEAG